MINVKREFAKGNIDLQEIYDNEYKILEITNNQLWNTDEQHPIVIKKDRRNDYISSTIIAEKIEDINLGEAECVELYNDTYKL